MHSLLSFWIQIDAKLVAKFEAYWKLAQEDDRVIGLNPWCARIYLRYTYGFSSRIQHPRFAVLLFDVKCSVLNY